ncbi:hemoglobin/transferrin/lactoferrin receptor protein [Ochrobactrum daejeonense]|uniref:Heme transporter BhuA n=1 Tax=Brucella daejeonensis TaxID=659015 RepID=A0A7W9AYW5_9HYPH|nr:TonB-dependent receptor [Brucella daejeonensis]MBB5702724.1 hemoglobin/transferrin/lactoferrin receptor protein [Brucella daejeonensis]
MTSNSFAQEQKASEDDAGVALKTITIRRAGGAQDPTAIPAPVGKVDRNAIDRFGGAKLDDALRGTAGVFTLQSASNPGVAVNIRGFEGSGRINMMIDGVPQSYRNTAHDAQGYAYIDPNLLSEIDIARGAVTTEGGTGLAGSVNFRTLGVDDVILDGKDKGVLGRASWGSNGTGFSEMLAGATRVNSIGIVAAISRHDADNYENGDGVTVQKSGEELTSGLFKAEFGLGEDQKLTLGGVLYNNHYGTYAVGYRPGTYTTYDMFLQNRTFFAQYNYNPSDNELIGLDVNIYHNSTLQNWEDGNGSFVGRQISTETTGMTASNTSRFNFGDVAVAWKNGFEINRDNASGNNTGVNPADAKSNRGAVFSEAIWNYQALQVVTGLRYDYFKLENEDGTVSNDDSTFNPKVTVAYNVTDWLQPYVTYAHSMRSPSLQETFLGGVAHSGQQPMHGNPDLRPEKQRGWEFGVNIARDGIFTMEDGLRIKANYYTMRVEDYITAASDYSQFVNIEGTSTVKGFELEARYDAGFAFGGLAYTHSTSELPEQTAGLGANQYLPEDVVTITAGGRFFERKLESGLRVQHVSSGKALGGGESTDPYTLVDLFAKYKFTDTVDLSLQVLNIADKTYTPALSSYGSGRGRTFLVSTQFQF